MVAAQAPSAVAATPEGKSIFLFADGTGNSSAKLFKTNVWRMYEAINLGLHSPGRYVQIGYYDNGVGTSNFKPLALLGGVFGIGLTDNVRRLYTFLCRNYQPNDRIYVFGFSRGAFTARLLVDLIASEGVIQLKDDVALSRQVRDVYREYRRKHQANAVVGKWIVALGRSLRDGILFLSDVIGELRRRAKKRPVAFVGDVIPVIKLRWNRQKPFAPPDTEFPDIEFVGVWDTVAAYGGPFAEFTRGIDDWVYPLSMSDYDLSPKVKKARHALSLDDERDAFWPLLWDEHTEAELITEGRKAVVGRNKDGTKKLAVRKVGKDRLRQVWFAGVHSDVGGGYPDESLSYIPFLWMVDELGKDVDFLPEFIGRAKNLANPYGPIHDSRSGVAAYYRYQPRKIAAFMNPPDVSTLSLRPPISDKPLSLWDKLKLIYSGKPVPKQTYHGLLKSVCVHESAVRRIISGIDNYAPSALPAEFEIVRGKKSSNSGPMLTKSDNDALRLALPSAPFRHNRQENEWDLVWKRRALYFATVVLTATLVLAPWLPLLQPVEQLCSDDRCFARSFVDVALFFVPDSLRNGLNPWVNRPLLVMLFGILILLSITLGRRTERRFRENVKTVWRQYLGKNLKSLGGRTGLRKFRESRLYQQPLTFLKWTVLPMICGIGTIAAIVYATFIVMAQIFYAAEEPGSTFCKLKPNPAKPVQFDIKDFCTDLQVEVEAGKPYRLTLKPLAAAPNVKEPWLDATLSAGPHHGVTTPHPLMTLFAPLKRVTSANWMQVLTEDRAKKADSPLRNWLSPAFGVPLDIRKHDLWLKKKDGTYQTIFCPRYDGHLYIMVNDAAPFGWKSFYQNDRGQALVSVERAFDKQCR